jgi:hypothetical protein
MGSVEAMFLLMSGSRSIGVAFASATVLNAESNAATIKDFIGLASLLNARGNHRNRARFRADNHIGVKVTSDPRDRKAGHSVGGERDWVGYRFLSPSIRLATMPAY